MGNLKVSLKLFVGFGIVILLTLALGGVSIYCMKELASFTERLYNRPYAVVTSLREGEYQYRCDSSLDERRRAGKNASGH